jgi:hypothetical protein
MTVDKNAYLINLSESDRTAFGRIDFRDQVEEQQIFSAIWELESQVNNGGFAQYFTSADGHTANFTPQALRRIGANCCAEIVARALHTVSPDPLSNDQLSRKEMINGLYEKAQETLEILDQEFFPILTISQNCCLDMYVQTHKCLVTFLPSKPPNKLVSGDCQYP